MPVFFCRFFLSVELSERNNTYLGGMRSERLVFFFLSFFCCVCVFLFLCRVCRCVLVSRTLSVGFPLSKGLVDCSYSLNSLPAQHFPHNRGWGNWRSMLMAGRHLLCGWQGAIYFNIKIARNTRLSSSTVVCVAVRYLELWSAEPEWVDLPYLGVWKSVLFIDLSLEWWSPSFLCGWHV